MRDGPFRISMLVAERLAYHDHADSARDFLVFEGPGGDHTFDFDDPEGNRLRFFSDMDCIGWDGMSRPKEQWQRFNVED